MKFATLIALVATVTAEAAVACDSTKEGWTAVTDDTLTAATADAAACGTAATAIAELEANVANDYCACATSTGKTDAVVADAAADPPVEEAAEVAASVTCVMYSKASADEAEDIRVAKADEAGPPTVAYEAWQWDAGVAMDAVAAADGDNAKMITSAIAAIATIAMVAM